jgi:hypothetical protein
MNILILICVTVPVFVAACVVFSIAKKQFLKIISQVLIIAVLAAWVFYNFESVQQPLRFNAEQKKRYDATVLRLKDIRTAQVAYRSEYKKYTRHFDTLIEFLKTDSFKVVKIIGDEDDSASVAAGKIIKETIKLSVLDSLFKKGYSVDSLRFVPFTEGVQFEMDTAFVKAGNVTVNVFEAKVPFEILLNGLDEQLLHNFSLEKQQRTGYAGLRVGSLTETTNNAGNWE